MAVTKPSEIVILFSIQRRADIRTHLRANFGANIRADHFGAELGPNCGANIRADAGAKLRANIWTDAGALCGADLGPDACPDPRTNIWANAVANFGAHVAAFSGAHH